MFRFARELGEWDVWTLADSITWPQLLWWIAYDELDPCGQERADWRIARMAADLVNLKAKPPVPISRYLPYSDLEHATPREPESAELMKAKLTQIVALHNRGLS